VLLRLVRDYFGYADAELKHRVRRIFTIASMRYPIENAGVRTLSLQPEYPSYYNRLETCAEMTVNSGLLVISESSPRSEIEISARQNRESLRQKI
jgi:hypothetical protein